MMKRGFTLWFTGLSGSGKTTLSRSVAEILIGRGYPVERLDGDEVRRNLTSDLGFTREDRFENIKRITYVAKLLSRNGVATLVAAITPYREMREKARKEIDDYVEVYVKCPLEVCEERDVKGLYKKAREGIIKQFTGIDDPYDEPENPEIVVDTSVEDEKSCVKKIIDTLHKLGYLEKGWIEGELDGYSQEEKEMISKRLEELGYL